MFPAGTPLGARLRSDGQAIPARGFESHSLRHNSATQLSDRALLSHGSALRFEITETPQAKTHSLCFRAGTHRARSPAPHIPPDDHPGADRVADRRLVLDANILVRAVLGTRVRGLIERYAGPVDLLVPESAIAEVQEHYRPSSRSAGSLSSQQWRS